MNDLPTQAGEPIRASERFAASIETVREAFAASGDGRAAIRANSDATDQLVLSLTAKLPARCALFAIGGYGRRELFPFSDLDLLFVLEETSQEREAKPAIRAICQELWDSGVRVAPITRAISECERVDPDNIEFSLSLLDLRPIAGDERVLYVLQHEVLPKLIERERRMLFSGVTRLTRERHAKYGNTLFHLEPNIKDCPGGLRDTHVCSWIRTLTEDIPSSSSAEALPKIFRSGAETPAPEEHDDVRPFTDAFDFLAAVRFFLHLRHGRDINTLDWKSQSAAGKVGVGIRNRMGMDTARWMQVYFRHARAVERRLLQRMDSVPQETSLLDRLQQPWRRKPSFAGNGFRMERGRMTLDGPTAGEDPAHDPDIVLTLFAVMAKSGTRLSIATEDRLESAIPLLSANLEEGPALWNQLREILCGQHAGVALRAMHAMGILELIIPEFHAIDALVIRDAYHRYTVDEHTFVLIDTLHNLNVQSTGNIAEWRERFGTILRELQHPELLYLAALLHDTGKGRSNEEHTHASAQMAEGVLARLELDSYDRSLVLKLIENHLEMSNALRRDIFDAETVRAFAAKVQTPEELRLLTLFTFADINAVHPDALTPWKAENLWRLYMATSNHLDRNIDEERVDSRVSSELVHHVTGLLQGQTKEVLAFLEGFPQRYLRTRTPEEIRTHFLMAQRLGEDSVQLEFNHAPMRSEVTLVTRDREMVFARVSGALAAWGMNIVTADAFSNAQGIVVDSFEFTDSFRTLELNPQEHDRFVHSIHDAMLSDEGLALQTRRRAQVRAPLRRIETRVEFDTESSTHSTILQVIAQDTPGLLHALAIALGEEKCNIEVAVIDTEGEQAIDVFYLTRDGMPLPGFELSGLQKKVEDFIQQNAEQSGASAGK